MRTHAEHQCIAVAYIASNLGRMSRLDGDQWEGEKQDRGEKKEHDGKETCGLVSMFFSVEESL